MISTASYQPVRAGGGSKADEADRRSDPSRRRVDAS
jgi:hypothetical protein